VIVIGITGGIAAGKSTVARELLLRGARVIDADQLGHRVYEPGTPAYRAVVSAFGPEIVAGDGSIDRAVLGARVFGRPEQLRRLTDIVWPATRRLVEQQIATIRAEEPEGIVVLEAVALLEAGWEPLVDEIWVVLVDRATAIERAVARGGLEPAAAAARLDAQLSNEQRIARADVVIDNSGDEAALRAQLDAHWRRLEGAAPARASA